MKRTVMVGTVEEWQSNGKWPAKVFVEVEYTDGSLSITQATGPTANGNAISCGQGGPTADREDWVWADGWSRELYAELLDTWKRWHLNYLRAGSPAQEAWLRDNPFEVKYPESHYTVACTRLAEVGLEPDPSYLHEYQKRNEKGEIVTEMRPYKYGSALLRDEVPPEVVDWLFNLPNPAEMPGCWNR